MKVLLWLVGVTFGLISALLAFSELSLRSDKIYAEMLTTDLPFPSANISLLRDIDGSEKQGRRRVFLNRDWGFILSNAEGKQPTFIPVSRYFISDFASIPKPFDAFFSPFGRHAEAAIVHDWLYAVGPGNEENSYEARRRADIIFYRAMRQQGTNPVSSRLMFSAVRIYGFFQSWFPTVFGKPSFGRDGEFEFVNPLNNSVRSPECAIEPPNIAYAQGTASRELGALSFGWVATKMRDTSKGAPDIFIDQTIELALASNPSQAFEVVETVLNEYEIDTYRSPATWTLADYRNYGDEFYEIDWWLVDRKPTCQVENIVASLRKHNSDSRIGDIIERLAARSALEAMDGIAEMLPAAVQREMASQNDAKHSVASEIIRTNIVLANRTNLALPGSESFVNSVIAEYFSNSAEIAYFEWILEQGIVDQNLNDAVNELYNNENRNVERNTLLSDTYNQSQNLKIEKFLNRF